jgi:hypothetical protein
MDAGKSARARVGAVPYSSRSRVLSRQQVTSLRAFRRGDGYTNGLQSLDDQVCMRDPSPPPARRYQEQRDYLARLGCHSYQGFLLSKPVPAEQFEMLLPGRRSRAVVA